MIAYLYSSNANIGPSLANNPQLKEYLDQVYWNAVQQNPGKNLILSYTPKTGIAEIKEI
jgi:hypothetical protein